MSVNLRKIIATNSDAPNTNPDLKVRIESLVVLYDRFIEHWEQYGLRPFAFMTLGSLVSDPIGFSDSDRLPQLNGPYLETYAAELRAILEKAAELLCAVDPTADPNVHTLERALG